MAVHCESFGDSLQAVRILEEGEHDVAGGKELFRGI